jgi:tryptophan synthase alpha chain
MQAIADCSQGFVYLVSVTGVTGVRTETATRVPDILSKLRTLTDKSIAVGFGIATPEQAKQVKDWGADGVIVGSAMVKLLAAEGVSAIERYCRDLKAAIR